MAEPITGELRDGLVLGAIGMVFAAGAAVAMLAETPGWLVAVLLVVACDCFGFGVAWLICGMRERARTHREVSGG